MVDFTASCTDFADLKNKEAAGKINLTAAVVNATI